MSKTMNFNDCMTTRIDEAEAYWTLNICKIFQSFSFGLWNNQTVKITQKEKIIIVTPAQQYIKGFH